MRSILIVHDDPDLRWAMTDAMRETDANVVSASSGRVGAQMIAYEKYDLALIAALLPDVPAIELAGLAANQNIPVLFISSGTAVDLELLQSGVRFLPRSFDLKDLISASERAIRDTRDTIARVQDSAARLAANLAGLNMQIAASYERLGALQASIGTKAPPRR